HKGFGLLKHGDAGLIVTIVIVMPAGDEQQCRHAASGRENRQAGDGDAISRWTPYDKPVVSAQKELSKLPVYQRVYQSLKTR
ncbi:hypothetical protein, partial [Escherichia coli]|uniref:hypothetical protein n=1 Tax=Escherichia coli TaxID=562 RepID=UPI003EE0608B